MAKIYRRLRDIEAQLQTELMGPQVIALQADLENIDRSAHFLPMRHSGLFLSVGQSGHGGKSWKCRLMALSGHPGAVGQCLLSGVKRTSPIKGVMSANDSKRTTCSKGNFQVFRPLLRASLAEINALRAVLPVQRLKA